MSSALTPFNNSLSPEAQLVLARKATTPPTNYRLRTVVIDAGHGGKDPGGMGDNSQEKHIALSIAKKLRDKITKKYPEITVIMTRSTDEFIPLFERAAIANRYKADLFISIHANIMPGSKATYGTETFVMGQHVADYNLKVAKRENASIMLEADYETNYDYDPNSDEGHILMSMYQDAFLEQSILFAELVEQQFAQHAGRKSRGVKQAGFVVLKATAMPSVLVETGFMSNLREEQYLLSDNGQNQLASAIFEAFAAYRQLMDASNKSSVPATAVNYTPVSSQSTKEVLVAAPPIAAVPQPLSRRERRHRQNTTLQNAPQHSSGTTCPPVVNSATTAQATPKSVPDTPLPAVLRKEVKTTTAAQPVVYKSPVTPPPTPAPRTTEVVPKIIYAVQLAATSRELALSEPRWKSFDMPLVVVKEGDFFKYQARGLDSPEAAKAARTTLQQLGFAEAFIVAYKDGVKLKADELSILLR